MDANTPDIVDLNRYISYLEDVANASPHTLRLFRRTLKTCELSSVTKSDISATWKYLLERFESKKTAWAFVLTAVKIVKAALNLEGVTWVRDYSYNELVGKLSKHRRDNPNPRVEYTDEDVQTIMRLTWENSRPTLFPAVVLMSLAGLRIGGCTGVKWTDFRTVEGVPGVRLFYVHSKGAAYDAAISEYGYRLLLASGNKYYKRDEVVYTPPDNTTPFEDTIRTRLRYLLVQKYPENKEMLKDKPMLHGFRKFAITQMAATLHKEDVALLAGHKIVGSTAFKFYIGKNREKINPEFEKRIALAYSNSPLMNWRLNATGLEHKEILQQAEAV